MRIRASTQAGVTAFRDLVKLLSELPDHIPPEINAASFVRFSAVPLPPIAAYHVISSCCASSCTPTRAGGAWKGSSNHTHRSR